MAILVLAAKYIKTSLKSFLFLLAMVGFPLLMTFFMGMAIQDLPEPAGPPPVSLLYCNLDTGETGRQLDDYLSGAAASGWLTVIPADETEYRTALAGNAFQVAVRIPSDFTTRFAAGQSATIDIVRGQVSDAASAAIEAVVGEFTRRLKLTRAVDTVPDPSAAAVVPGILDQAASERGDYLTVRQPAVGGTFTSRSFFAVTTMVMFLLVAGSTGAIRLIEERETKTLLRVYAAPVTKSQVLLGNLLGQMTVTCCQAFLIILATGRLFGIVWGDWGGIIAATAAVSFVSTAMAFLVACLFNSARVAGGAVPVFVSAMTFVSGGMTGIENLSPVFRTLSDFTLNKWANGAYFSLMLGGRSSDIGTNLAVLAGAGLGITLLAMILANRREAFYE